MKRWLLTVLLLTIWLAANAKTYLVSVGVGDYTHYPTEMQNLGLTTSDAKTIAELYKKNSGVEQSLLLDSRATKSNIVKTIENVLGNAKEDDIVVFFFSGHGYSGGVCAYDGRLSYQDIRKAMARSRSKNKMMFVDACHSGGLRVPDKDSQKASQASKDSNVMLFLAARNNESSIENSGMKNGFFTSYLQSGLKGNADKNRDKVITAKELFEYVHGGVVKISSDMQHPVMWGKFSDNMPVMIWR